MEAEVIGMAGATLGSMIRSLRKQNHMTQAMLAQKLGITDKAVSKWERDLSYPDLSLFPRLADLLGVTVEDLLGACTEEENPSRLAHIFSMSHDVRTPLNLILGYADLAEKYRGDPQRLQRYLQNIRYAGEYLLLVIDRLMHVARGGAQADAALPFHADEIEKAFESMPFAPALLPVRCDFAGKRVLLAEDIALNRELLFELLRPTGAETEFAEDGCICLQKLCAAPEGYYDLILMDVQMPNLDGIETTRRIRALENEKKRSIPIVAMTANVYEADRRAALGAGMNEFLEKPIVVDKLYETLRRYL